jgi:hypothetical protein
VSTASDECDPDMRQDVVAMTLERASWIAVVAACVIAAVALFVSDYVGYGFVAIAVGVSAAINVR